MLRHGQEETSGKPGKGRREKGRREAGRTQEGRPEKKVLRDASQEQITGQVYEYVQNSRWTGKVEVIRKGARTCESGEGIHRN
jgi:hypothetical protein